MYNLCMYVCVCVCVCSEEGVPAGEGGGLRVAIYDVKNMHSQQASRIDNSLFYMVGLRIHEE